MKKPLKNLENFYNFGKKKFQQLGVAYIKKLEETQI